jgi:hypothetical protein
MPMIDVYTTDNAGLYPFRLPERNSWRAGSRFRDGASEDGHGWFRTTDLSRVKRALSH